MMQKSHEQSPPSAEQSLEMLLASWAAEHALSGTGAEVIRREILRRAQEPGVSLPYEWWVRFFQDLQIGLRRSVYLACSLQPCQTPVRSLPA
jgi:predicted thioredoxin/glutaredoxin